MRFRDGNRTVSLGGKNSVRVVAGDRLTIHSPGGGGHGTPLSPDAAAAAAAAAATSGGGRGGGDGGGFDDMAASGGLEDPDRKSRRVAEMRLSGSVSGHRLGQEQA